MHQLLRTDPQNSRAHRAPIESQCFFARFSRLAYGLKLQTPRGHRPWHAESLRDPNQWFGRLARSHEEADESVKCDQVVQSPPTQQPGSCCHIATRTLAGPNSKPGKAACRKANKCCQQSMLQRILRMLYICLRRRLLRCRSGSLLLDVKTLQHYLPDGNPLGLTFTQTDVQACYSLQLAFPDLLRLGDLCESAGVAAVAPMRNS
mmetsp:Transcript_2104/g.5019  ORF Transcript_2104/g.5019 Transcript_2104/m.5019 type:complete len:205 (-) Transcript_2104:7-621(-)